MNGKFLIASDIHGSAFWCKKLVDAFYSEGADRLLLLGDLLYHGPRNPLPLEYSPQAVFEMLNALQDKITAVRGNCDSEVDQMVLSFPMLAGSALIFDGTRNLFLTHGHLYNDANPPLLKKGDLLFNGHFHTPCHKTLEKGALYINCGSVSIPKDGTPHSYILLENNTLVWKNLETGEAFDKIIL